MSKVEYKLKETPISPYSVNFMADYLRSVGVDKVSSFLGPIDKEDEESYRGLNFWEEAIDTLHWGFTNNKKFFLQVDSDADGYTSSSIFYAYFKGIFPESHIEWRLHEEKEHGIILETVPIESDIIVVPDAGSSQLEMQAELSRQGRKVVIMDHHLVDHNETIENVILVNNQNSDNFKNKDLSGAGVVYKIIQAYYDKYGDKNNPVHNPEQFADLAAVGIISDMMDIRQLDNNYIIRKGLSSIKNPMLIAILEKQSFSVSDIWNPNKIDIAFYVAPIINGVIRFGSMEEKENLFKGMSDYFIEELIPTIYQGAKRFEHFYDYVARESYNAKERQNRQKMKALEAIDEYIQKHNLYNNQLIAVEVSQDVVPKTLTGLVAMEILKKYNKPALVLRPREVDGEPELWGSGRGKANQDFTSLRNFLLDSGLCTFAEGHDFAHGVGVKVSELDDLIDHANEALAHIDFDVSETEVDYVFKTNALEYKMLKEFGENIDVYGYKIPQPKFAFDFTITPDQIQIIGKSRNVAKLFLGGVELIKFHTPETDEFVNKMKQKGQWIKLKAVGRAQINSWMDKSTPQIIIDEWELVAESPNIKTLF